MNIIHEGNISYIKRKYTGECVNCGCVFETTVNVISGKAQIRYVPESDVEITKISGHKLMCSCPQCGYKYVLLKEPDGKES